jgi:hypothetical protein
MLKPRKVLAILCSAYRDDEVEKVSLQMDCIKKVTEILKLAFSLTPQSFQNNQQTVASLMHSANTVPGFKKACLASKISVTTNIYG